MSLSHEAAKGEVTSRAYHERITSVSRAYHERITSEDTFGDTLGGPGTRSVPRSLVGASQSHATGKCPQPHANVWLVCAWWVCVVGLLCVHVCMLSICLPPWRRPGHVGGARRVSECGGME